MTREQAIDEARRVLFAAEESADRSGDKARVLVSIADRWLTVAMMATTGGVVPGPAAGLRVQVRDTGGPDG